MSDIDTNLRQIKLIISETAASCRRNPASIELIAVSKNHPSESIRLAMASGQVIFGESKVQEAKFKIPLLPSEARWHLIGHLQKNKIRHALPLFEMIHGVDTLELAVNINRIAGEMGLFPKVLLEVNIGQEATKYGFAAEDVKRDIEQLCKLDRLQIEGLMTIAPIVEKEGEARRYFAALRELRDELQQASGLALPHLSMGMSDDFKEAILEGSTMVRIGTAIFGPRSLNNPKQVQND